jgi:hypothetical protein
MLSLQIIQVKLPQSISNTEMFLAFNLLTAKSMGARMTTGYGWTMGRISSPSRVENFSLLHIIETVSGAHPASSMCASVWSPPHL